MNKIRVKPHKPVYRVVSPPAGLVYEIRKTDERPSLIAGKKDAVWSRAMKAAIDNFHPESSRHRPKTVARALYSDEGLSVRFEVADRFVRAIPRKPQDRVSRDSCVECFIQPPGAGYFNFEVNCGGIPLVYYIEDPTRPDPANGKMFTRFKPVLSKHLKMLEIVSTLPAVVEPEIATPTNWQLSFFVPWAFIEAYIPKKSLRFDTPWRGNFFKCGDETSHPHWASWNPIGKILRFHQPDRFGTFQFDLSEASARKRK